MGHGGHVPPLLQMAAHGGTVSQETDQTVLLITKALTKTTNCAFRAKKWRGTTKFFFRRFAPDRCPHFCFGPVPPTFKFVPAQLIISLSYHRSVEETDFALLLQYAFVVVYPHVNCRPIYVQGGTRK